MDMIKTLRVMVTHTEMGVTYRMLKSDVNIVKEGIEKINDEQSAIQAEIQGFQQFKKMIRPLAIVLPKSKTSCNASCSTPEDILQAYRDTVMSVSHYRIEYTDDIGESIREEFGEQIEKIMQEKNQVTPEVKRRVLSAADRAESQRESFYKILDIEKSSLETAHSELILINNRLGDMPSCSANTLPLSEVVSTWNSLNQLEQRCEEIATNRQHTHSKIRRQELALREPLSLDQYLYRELNTKHPVLSAVTNTIQSIESKRTANEVSTVSV